MPKAVILSNGNRTCPIPDTGTKTVLLKETTADGIGHEHTKLHWREAWALGNELKVAALQAAGADAQRPSEAKEDGRAATRRTP